MSLNFYCNNYIVNIKAWLSCLVSVVQFGGNGLMLSWAPTDSTLPSIQQYVDYNTWDNKTLDHLYADSRNAYKAPTLPPVGISDNNLVLLRSQYVPALQRLHVAMKSVMRWIQEACEVLLHTPLRQCTVGQATWGWHHQNRGLYHKLYKFLQGYHCPKQHARCLPKNKPWITIDLKALMNEKKRVFSSGNKNEQKRIQYRTPCCPSPHSTNLNTSSAIKRSSILCSSAMSARDRKSLNKLLSIIRSTLQRDQSSFSLRFSATIKNATGNNSHSPLYNSTITLLFVTGEHTCQDIKKNSKHIYTLFALPQITITSLWPYGTFSFNFQQFWKQKVVQHGQSTCN